MNAKLAHPLPKRTPDVIRDCRGLVLTTWQMQHTWHAAWFMACSMGCKHGFECKQSLKAVDCMHWRPPQMRPAGRWLHTGGVHIDQQSLKGVWRAIRQPGGFESPTAARCAPRGRPARSANPSYAWAARSVAVLHPRRAPQPSAAAAATAAAAALRMFNPSSSLPRLASLPGAGCPTAAAGS